MNSKKLLLTPYLLLGIIFTVNSQIMHYFVKDQGFNRDISAIIAILIMIIPILQKIWIDFKNKQAKMLELIFLAIIASCTQGNYTMSASIAIFMLFSLLIEGKTATGAEKSLEILAKLAPGKVRVSREGKEILLESHQVNIGDIVIVLPGENILIDGKILLGNTSINEANITGESYPVDKGKGNSVFAGTLNLTGRLEIVTEKVGVDTAMGKIRELIMSAENTRHPFVHVVDEYIKYYIPLIIAIALIVLFFSNDFNRVTALLVASCPIALILATPTAIVASLSSAARLGIFIKDINDLEAFEQINAFVFDKTGTLTTGNLEVVRLNPNQGIKAEELLKYALIAEKMSNHPVAIAIKRVAKKVGITDVHPTDIHEEPGRGLRVRYEGETIYAGNLKWMEESGVIKEGFEKIEETEGSGMSLLFVMKDKKPIGWIGLNDKSRPDAKENINLLKEKVDFTAIISGDRPQVVKKVAKELMIDNYCGAYSPEQKANYVKDLIKKGFKVAFIGDGVNDGPALASSHIGIAMGAEGSAVAMETATISLMNSRLNRLPFLKLLAKKMKWTIIQNFVIGTLFIICGIFLSSIGFLHPTTIATLQFIGTLTVVMNSARLIRQGENISIQEEM